MNLSSIRLSLLPKPFRNKSLFYPQISRTALSASLQRINPPIVHSLCNEVDRDFVRPIQRGFEKNGPSIIPLTHAGSSASRFSEACKNFKFCFFHRSYALQYGYWAFPSGGGWSPTPPYISQHRKHPRPYERGDRGNAEAAAGKRANAIPGIRSKWNSMKN